MPIFHILNGDCLAEQLALTAINQNLIIFRECLLDGDLKAATLSDFWKTRANFISKSYNISPEDYYTKTVVEIEKINAIPARSEVCLWFENDLFCQVNMWFILNVLAFRTDIKIFRIFPIIKNKQEIWNGFGDSTVDDLENSFHNRIEFQQKDLELGKKLWLHFQNNDLKKLEETAKNDSACFEYLKEICEAHHARFANENQLNRPQRVMQEIIQQGYKTFPEAFLEFTKREGIYGFGDLQVIEIFKKLTEIPKN